MSKVEASRCGRKTRWKARKALQQAGALISADSNSHAKPAIQSGYAQ
jgi:hypothetical protein